MKRWAVVLLIVGAVSAPFWLLPGKSMAALGTGQCFYWAPTTCGYFKGTAHDTAGCNVLPGASWCCRCDTSALYDDYGTNTFLPDMHGYLFDTGNSGWDLNARVGAAFLVDAMLGMDYNNGNPTQGVTDARNSYAQWSATVSALAANSCSSLNTLKCSGTSFGVNWGYIPPSSDFCGDWWILDSGYDPSIGDAALYGVADGRPGDGTVGDGDLTKCTADWNQMQPEIVFWWNGGANTFRIGKRCGNLVQSSTPLPTSNLPDGTISVSCIDPKSGLQSAHITFRDQDAATSAYVTTGTWKSATYTSSAAGVWATDDVGLPLPPTTDAYNQQPVTLHVLDTGQMAPPNSWYTWTVQSDAPCVNYGCTGPSTDPIRLDPYMSYSLTVGVKPSVGQLPPNPTIDVQSIITPGGANYWSHGQVAAANNNGVEEAVFANVPKTGSTGMFTVNWNLYTNGVLLKQCSGTFPVVNLPYLNVYGGDVLSGAAPMAGSGCSVNNAAGVYSWNQYGPGGGYAGAGAEYAVQALGQIEEFGSAMNPSTSSPPTDLSFANSGLPANELNPPTQGLFGGFFGDTSGAWACGTDYAKGLGKPVTADVTISGHSVGVGVQEMHYISGHDVYITGNVTYNGSGGWTNPKDIPLLKVVVTGGNIYIDSSVTQLDGIYVAEPSGGSGGQIIDCATNAGGVWKQVDPTVDGFYNTCHNPLAINGAFVAEQVLFGRTNGSLGQATAGDSLSTNHDAEVFNYTPEVWLPRSATTPADTYDAITALPPVL